MDISLVGILLSICTQIVSSELNGKSALIIIDVQNCFLPGGSLAVNEADQVIPVINKIRASLDASFDVVAISQDWHCPDHVSFASQHPGYSPSDVIDLHYSDDGSLCITPNVTSPYAKNCTGSPRLLQQNLWPDHCVINTTGAEIGASLTHKESDIIVYKGNKCHLDSYSVFYDNGRYGETRLRQELESRKISSVYITGLATDYCVFWSAKDAHEIGFKTYVVVDATRGVAPDSVEAALREMDTKGIHLINSTDLLAEAPSPGTGVALTSSTTVVTLVWAMCVLIVAFRTEDATSL